MLPEFPARRIAWSADGVERQARAGLLIAGNLTAPRPDAPRRKALNCAPSRRTETAFGQSLCLAPCELLH